MSPPYTAILRELSLSKFAEIFNTCSRQARQAYFHRHAVRAPKKKKAGLPKAGAKNEARTALLYEVLRDKDDDEMADEILRTWLLTKRLLLAAALNHLGIPHEEGITDSDELEKQFEEIDVPALRALIDAMIQTAPLEDVQIYLEYMGAPKLDEALAGN